MSGCDQGGGPARWKINGNMARQGGISNRRTIRSGFPCPGNRFGVMEQYMRTLSLLLLLFVSAASARATEPKIHRDLPYADSKNKLQTLDIYAPQVGTNHPVAIWIHGEIGRAHV